MKKRSRRLALTLSGTLALLPAVGLNPSAALAANADACGTVTQQTLARSFGLANTIEHKSVLSKPASPGGVVHTRCLATAYKGSEPSTRRKRRAGLLAGKVAEVRFEAWVADSSPTAETWLANFGKRLAALKREANARFVHSLHGSTYKPPGFGAEAAVAYQARVGLVRKVRAIWWDRRDGTLLVVNAEQEKAMPVRASLRKLMAGVVPGVFFTPLGSPAAPATSKAATVASTKSALRDLL